MTKALFLTQENPFPPRGSDKFRDFHVLRLLCEQMDSVEVLCFAEGSGPNQLKNASEEIPANLTISEMEKHTPGFLHRLFQPRALNPYSDCIEDALEKRAEPGKLLWISRLLMASCVPWARSLGYHVILDEHNVESAVLKQNLGKSPLKKIPGFLIAAQASYYESRFCLKSNAVVAASELDAKRLARIAPGAEVHLIPNTVDHESFEPARSVQGKTLFFSGSLSHPTNVEGLKWFIAEIVPRLRARLGDRIPPIVVAGSNPSVELQGVLRRQGITVHANPPSMIPYFSNAAVVFVPIRSGGGTPLKILEAMAAGKPVVSTGKATEGLVLAPTYDILIADNADSFATAILRLLENPQLRTDMGIHAAKTVLSRYDWRCAREVISDLLRSLPARAMTPQPGSSSRT